MVALAGRHLDHEDVDSWLEILRTYLNGDREPEIYGTEDVEDTE